MSYRTGCLDPANAEAYYRLALQQEEKASGKETLRVAIVLNDLGLALRQKDDNRGAEPLFRRALVIQEKALGPNNASVASTLNNLGSLLQSTGQLDEAERVERRALRIFEDKLGPESMELGIASQIYGSSVDQARPLSGSNSLCRAVSIDESSMGGKTRKLGWISPTLACC